MRLIDAPGQETNLPPRHDDVRVLKFGSSVLRSPRDLCEVATEIYRFSRTGAKVVAVVSAFAGETDRLIGEANRLAGGPGARHFARYVALGEERASSALALVCDAIGLDTEVLGSAELGIVAGGPVDDALPESINLERLMLAIGRRDAVIVPGFAAIGRDGHIVLLGRGGSDLTAVFLASVIGTPTATLVKDVDGVYECDPALAGARARRYFSISWNDAAAIAGRLVQPKAIEFAQTRGTKICIRRVGEDRATMIGADSAPPAAHAAARPLRIAIVGLGVVGGGAAHRLLGDGRFEIVGALVRDVARHRDDALGGLARVATADALLERSPDLIIDALSDGAAGRYLTEAALARGVGVISANKQALAGDLARLTATARASGAVLSYAASVGGGAPIVETVRRARAAGRIHHLEATLNGTVNFILSGIARGAAFQDAVAAAQRAGFAEEDPSADLGGADAAAKAAILIHEAFGVDLDPRLVDRQPLDAALYQWMMSQGGVWRQVTSIDRDGDAISASIAMVEVALHSPMARAADEGNAIRIDGQAGVFEARGRGAGRIPTVESILADLHDARRAMAARA